MSDSKCYLCDKPGQFEKLFRSCKHESACYDCLRNRYIVQARHVCKYPLECFHRDCNRTVRNTQIERFIESERELKIYHDLNQKAKTHKVQLGENWKDILEILGEALGSIEICRCPKCKMLITKYGGCDHMTCICGAEFNWIASYIPSKSSDSSYLIEDFRAVEGPKKKKTAPVLREDDADFFADYDSFSDPDDSSTDDTIRHTYASSGELETVSNVCNTIADLIPSDLDSVPSDLQSFPSVSLEERGSAAFSVSAADVSVGTKIDWEEQDFEVLELAADDSDDSWTQFDDAAESTHGSDDFQTSSQATWEEISEVSSVVTFHSETGISFLEAARAPSSSQSTTSSSSGWKELPRAPKPMIPLNTISEHPKLTVHDSSEVDQQGEMFDADFMLEGAKFSRGGKQKYRFKHQPRRKYHRFDQRQRSSARLRQF